MLSRIIWKVLIFYSQIKYLWYATFFWAENGINCWQKKHGIIHLQNFCSFTCRLKLFWPILGPPFSWRLLTQLKTIWKVFTWLLKSCIGLNTCIELMQWDLSCWVCAVSFINKSSGNILYIQVMSSKCSLPSRR